MKILPLILGLSACAATPTPAPIGNGQSSEARYEAEARVRPLPPLVTPDTGGPVRYRDGVEEIFRPGKGWTPVRGAAQ